METQNLATLYCDEKDCMESKVIDYHGQFVEKWHCDKHKKI